MYAALLQRNTFALRLHFATKATGDAAELVVGLGAAGDFSGTAPTWARWPATW